MTQQFVAAIIRALIILGGMFAITRNLGIFFAGELIGHSGKRWFDRPYLFRALASAFTLFWIFGPFVPQYNVFHLTITELRTASLALYLLAAAAWLWIERISFLDGIPQQELPQGPAWAHWLGWQGHASLTFVIQFLSAAALGILFVVFGNSALRWLVVLPFLIGTAGMSFWRFTTLTGDNHSLGERLQHVLAGRDVGPPHDPSRDPQA